MLAAISIFITVFLLVLAITGQFSSDRQKVVKRMDRYMDITGVSEGYAPVAEDSINGPNPMREMLGTFGKSIEKKAFVHWLDLQLEKAEIPLKGYEFFFLDLAFIGGAALLCLMINPHPVSVFVTALVGGAAPVIWLRQLQQRRLQKFNAQIADALVLISNSLKAGYGFMQAMEMVARESPTPIRSEFARVLKEINLGITTEEALHRMVRRVPSPDWDLVVTAMLIQRQIGGNLSEILDNIINTIRERIRIKGEIKTLTAQGRMSGMIIGLLPVALSLFMLMINPDYILRLVKDPRGQAMLVAALFAMVFGIMVIQKIIRVDV